MGLKPEDAENLYAETFFTNFYNKTKIIFTYNYICKNKYVKKDK